MKWKVFEISLALGLVFAILFSALALTEQEALSEKLIRLHVRAHSDDPADQALKLLVRDAVLETASTLLEPDLSAAEAERRLAQHTAAIEQSALRVVREQGYDYPVSVSVAPAVFPERAYDSFSLPAGRYTSLLVEIGEADGQNWWCVVFPPLCMGAASDFDEAAALSGLSDKDICFITKTDDYVLKFKSLELLAKLGEVFS